MTIPSSPGTPEVPPYENPPSNTETTGKVQQAASTASDEAGRVADVAKEQAQEVASEVGTQARDLVGELKTQVRDQSVLQRDRLSETLRQFGDDLDEMNRSTTSSGLASDLAGQAASKAREFSSFLNDHEPGDLIEQIRDFARRRPGAFLLSAAIAGVVAGRLTRGAVASSSADTSSASRSVPQADRPTLTSARQPRAAQDPSIGPAAETPWNVGNRPAEQPAVGTSDPTASSVGGGSGLLAPDEPSARGQGRP
ncbi:MAG TPA: hypothetical protein VIQ02_19235 [Jiangellaceae bacterium]